MKPGEMIDFISIPLALVLGGILLVCVNHFSYGWRGPSKSGARLPKGSFGFPVIGESIALARNHETFVSSRIKRYGTVFKSNLFLRPNIVGTTPEFAKFVFSNGHLFGNRWHAGLTRLLGPRAFAFKDGPSHMRVKNYILKVLRPDFLQPQVNVLESIILRSLASWEQRGTVVARHVTEEVTVDSSMWILIGAKDIRSTPEGRKAVESFMIMEKAVLTFPLNLPGSLYCKGLKAKACLASFFKTIFQQRKDGSENTQNDLLGALLSGADDAEAPEELKELNDDDLVDNLCFIMFNAVETTATTLTWVLKYLIEHPDVFRRLRAEHQEILTDKGPSDGGPRLTWEDTKKMVYTLQVFHEINRIAALAPFVLRTATQDIEFEGQLIPKGWGVTATLQTIHLDPAIYPNPNTFNPDRFKVTPKSYTYLPFGSGAHMCPGKDIAKLVVLIFVHHITTTYTYESVGPDLGWECSSIRSPVGGFPINVRRAMKAD